MHINKTTPCSDWWREVEVEWGAVIAEVEALAIRRLQSQFLCSGDWTCFNECYNQHWKTTATNLFYWETPVAVTVSASRHTCRRRIGRPQMSTFHIRNELIVTGTAEQDHAVSYTAIDFFTPNGHELKSTPHPKVFFRKWLSKATFERKKTFRCVIGLRLGP